MPARRQTGFHMPNHSLTIAPVNRDPQILRPRNAQSEMEIRTAFPGMPVAAIYLLDQLPAAGKVHGCARADSG